MARDVFHHHDRIVDDKPRRHRQRHQRQIVEQEPRHVHHAQRTKQRYDHCGRGNHGRVPALQKQADDQHHQNGRNEQRHFDLGQRCADRDGAIGRKRQLDVIGQQRLQPRDLRLDRIDGLHDIGIGLTRDDDRHGLLAVEQAHRARVFGRIDHFADIHQPHRSAIAIGDDRWGKILGSQRRIIAEDLPGEPARTDRRMPRRLRGRGDLFDHPARAIGAGRLQRGAYIFHRDAVAREQCGIDFDPHRRQRRAAQFDVADAGHLQQLLLHDVRHRVIDLVGGA